MEEKKDCLFCKMASGEIKVEKIMETDNFFVIKDKYPVSEGHSLIISKKHYENILHFPSILGNELIALVKEVYIELSKKTSSEGFNFIQNNFKVAGQAIPHTHFHIIPRKENDGVKLN
jgi:histidine triad (HIT) family protein